MRRQGASQGIMVRRHTALFLPPPQRPLDRAEDVLDRDMNETRKPFAALLDKFDPATVAGGSAGHDEIGAAEASGELR